MCMGLSWWTVQNSIKEFAFQKWIATSPGRTHGPKYRHYEFKVKFCSRVTGCYCPVHWDRRIKVLTVCQVLQCNIYRGMTLTVFTPRARVCNLNYHLNCAIWIIIQMTVFWTACTQICIVMRNLNDHSNEGTLDLCTQNYIAMRDLNCAIKMTVRTIIRIVHFKLCIAMWFGVHMVQNTVIRMIIQIAQFEW